MSMIQSDLLLGQEGGAGYVVQRSLRFSSIDSGFCSRSVTAGNQKTWSLSFWLKRAVLGTDQEIFATANGDLVGFVRLTSGNLIRVFSRNASAVTQYDVSTVAVLRDCSAWYHILVVQDTTQAASGDRIKIYINGTLQTLTTATAASLNADCAINSTNTHNIGNQPGASVYLSAYLADVVFADGQALTPSSLTEVSATTGQLIPKAYTGSFGTNGFWLKFSDNSAATATTLGKDYSGNNNNWSCNNLSVFSGALGTIYTPPSGFSVWSDVFDTGTGSITYSNSNKTATATNTSEKTVRTATAKSTGKWYIEFVRGVVGNSADEFWGLVTSTSAFPGNTGSGGVGWAISRAIYNNWGSGTSETISAAAYSSGSVVQLAVDFTAKKLWWGIDNNWLSGDPSNGTTPSFYGWSGTPSWYAAQRLYYSGSSATINEGPAAVLRNNDSTVDTPSSAGTDTGVGGVVTGNYCTWNAVDVTSSNLVLSNGCLDVSRSSSTGGFAANGTISVLSGKWYYEVTIGSFGGDLYVGMANSGYAAANYSNGTFYLYKQDGSKYSSAGGSSSYGSSWTAGDVIGVAFDADAGSMVFYKNGTSQGTAFTGIASSTGWKPTFMSYSPGTGSSTTPCSANFGQRPFAYPVSGYKCLCDTSLPLPVNAKPSSAFDVKLITANNSTQAITGLSFSPDLVWTKSRSQALSHYLYDTVRGAQKLLISNATNAESTITDSLISFDAGGFTLGANDGANYGSGSSVAWCFDAGANTVTNTQGSITGGAQVRANPSAGFSIITFTMGSGSYTVGHGLNTAPSLLITKARSNTSSWWTYHASLGTSSYLALNSTAAAASDYSWGSAPTSTVFTANNDFFTNGYTYVVYAFSPVAGYSSMGSYVGNGSTDGPFVWCGFRPRWILIKASSAAGAWILHDTARSTYNVMGNELRADLSDAEYQVDRFDLLSNGFKVRSSNSTLNASSATYIYFAVAESPFAYSRAR